MNYKKYLPEKKAKAEPSGIMIRPDQEICNFLVKLANEEGCSTNQICIAIIKAEYYRTKEALAASAKGG